MTRAFCFFLTLVYALALRSQSGTVNNNLRLQLSENRHIKDQITLLVKGNIAGLIEAQTTHNFTLNYYVEDIASLTTDLNTLAILLENKIVLYAELPEARKTLLNDTMMKRNRIVSVKQGETPLKQAYNGSGVVVGIIDTGIDFNHSDFKDSLGNSRVKFLWDQVPVSGSTVPAPFNYGIEWTAAQIDASQCTHSDAAYYGHGTHVAGIAAGNGLANGKHCGIASKSDLVVVALDFNKVGPTISDAVKYIFDKAALLGKPCVINASVGDYYGSHDGTDLETKLIEGMLKGRPGRALVAAVGNAGSLAYHTKTNLQNSDTLFTWLKNGSSQMDYWCYADTLQIKDLQLSVGANRSTYFDLGRTGFKNWNDALNTVMTDTLKYNNKRIGIVKTAAGINIAGVYELYVQILADSVGLLWRIETKGKGLHHAWNFDFVSSNLPTPQQFPYISKYVSPDTLYTIVSGFQCSNEVITVGNYCNLQYYYDVNSNLQDNGQTVGKLAFSSSSGPTRDGRQKPDVSASGQFIFSAAVLTMLPYLITNDPAAIAEGGMHIRGGGSSAASPIVAGLAALYFQKDQFATNRILIRAITYCAYNDEFTGTQLPNYQYGFGKLDGKNTMNCGENPAGISVLSNRNSLHCFPNPFQDDFTVLVPKQIKQGTLTIQYPDGRILYTQQVNGNEFHLHLKDHEQDRGLLFLIIRGEDYTYTQKLLKN